MIRSSGFHNHHKLILLCARKEQDQQTSEHIRNILASGVQWDHCIQEAIRLELASLLWWNLRHFAIPPGVADRLRTIYFNNVNRNLILSNELLSLCRLFEAESIRFVPLKGVILADRVFGHSGLRYLQDLDILIRKEDLNRIATLLCTSGEFTPIGRLDSHDDSQRTMTFAKAGGSISYHLDLQWKLKESFLRIPAPELWRNLVEYDWHGLKVQLLSPELTLIHLTHHWHSHAYTLKILVDISETLQNYGHSLDWDKIMTWVAEWKIKRNFVTALECVASVLGPLGPEQERDWKHLCGSCGWRSSIVSNPEWYFSRAARKIQNSNYLRVSFSALFVDGSFFSFVRAFFRRAGHWIKSRTFRLKPRTS